MTRRDENTSPLGRIILARAEVLGARRRADPHDDRALSLKEMSDEVLRLTGQKLTRGAINEWILGRVKRPTPELLGLLAAALADYDCDRYALERDMRAAIGLPPESAAGVPVVDCSGLAADDVSVLNTLADRLRAKGREAAEAAVDATQRVGRSQPTAPPHRGDVVTAANYPASWRAASASAS